MAYGAFVELDTQLDSPAPGRFPEQAIAGRRFQGRPVDASADLQAGTGRGGCQRVCNGLTEFRHAHRLREHRGGAGLPGLIDHPTVSRGGDENDRYGRRSRVGGQLRPYELDGARPLQEPVLGQPHLAHPALAKLPLQRVLADLLGPPLGLDGHNAMTEAVAELHAQFVGAGLQLQFGGLGPVAHVDVALFGGHVARPRDHRAMLEAADVDHDVEVPLARDGLVVGGRDRSAHTSDATG